MKLIIKRNQDSGFFGGISFTLDTRVVLEPNEEELVRKYKVKNEVLFTGKGGEKRYTIKDLLTGVHDKCEDVSILLKNEEVYKNAAQHFKTLLDVMNSFGGEQEIEY